MTSFFLDLFCFKHNVYQYLTALRTSSLRTRSGLSYLLALIAKRLPQPVVDLFIGKFSFWVLAASTGLSLFVEEKRRRAELAMYVLPKALESAWVMARGKGLVVNMGRFGDVLVSWS